MRKRGKRERWALGLTFKDPRAFPKPGGREEGRKEGRKEGGFRGALTIARNFQMNGAREQGEGRKGDATPAFSLARLDSLGLIDQLWKEML